MTCEEYCQVVLVVFGIAYKYLLLKEKILGWVLSVVSSIFTFSYMYVFYRLPIIMSLEICFMSLSLYGMYKHRIKLTQLTKIDYTVIILTIIAIIYFTLKQLEVHTTKYQIMASIAFLSGVILLAQNNSLTKIIAWTLYSLGSISLGIIFIQDSKYILLVLHVVSLVIGYFAIKKILENRS